jgi:hypothetical protein
MADNSDEIWRPGSFTKNFSWGERARGLIELHRIIRLGFDGEVTDVPRDVFRDRVRNVERPDFIPLNFFLFNKPVGAVDYIVADELVFQSVNSEHSAGFDKLALFAFNFSFAGKWSGSTSDQRRPALWANAYIREQVAGRFDWDTKLVNADDIEQFISRDSRYRGKTTRKLATNLNYLYTIGDLSGFPTKKIERWWVDALFLALDRLIEDRELGRVSTFESDYGDLLSRFHFLTLTGRPSLEKQLAAKHLVSLYIACGGRQRFSEGKVRERTETLVGDVEKFLANDPRPRGAVHPTNPRILKSIPYACAMLAKYAGFEVLDPNEMEAFDLEDFVRKGTQRALEELRRRNIRPTMTAEELMRITREK